MNRAERRRQAREQKKSQRGQEKAQGQNSGPCPNGHPEQAQAWMLHGTPPTRCPRCGEIPEFGGQAGGFSMSANLSEATEYGMPERVTRQWVVENSDKDAGLGIVPIPLEHQDGLITHAEYWAECDHIEETCDCKKNPAVMWRLESFSG